MYHNIPLISLRCTQGLSCSTYTYNIQQLKKSVMIIFIEWVFYLEEFQFIIEEHIFITQDKASKYLFV